VLWRANSYHLVLIEIGRGASLKQREFVGTFVPVYRNGS
jgi:hypothetical protein